MLLKRNGSPYGYDKRPRSPKAVRRLMQIWERDRGICHICGNFAFSPETGFMNYFLAATPDHLVPASQGGGNRLDNLAIAHKWCNSLRSDKPLTPELRAEIAAKMKCKLFD